MIKYIGYFDFQDSDIPRNYAVSASNKMEYIVDAINDSGYDVELISVSASTEQSFKFHKADVKIRNPHFSVRYFATFGGQSKIIKVLRNVWHTLALFFFLLFRTHKNETVIVYHSLGYYNAILLAKRIKKFKLILEVEECYQDVSPTHKVMCQWEYLMFEMADAYIFSTELLNEKLNPSHKPHVVIYGTYRVEPQVASPADDGKIHVVYAGTFDVRKGGDAAAAAAMFLPDNYHLHVLGFGNGKDTKRIKQVISDTVSQSAAAVTFEGLLKGNRYIEFLQKSHIGLSTQDPSAIFNTTSFPSKILSYLANGLHVVSIRIDAISKSAIGDNLTYYSEQTPQKIAEAILAVDVSAPYNSRQVVMALDKRFVTELHKLIG